MVDWRRCFQFIGSLRRFLVCAVRGPESKQHRQRATPFGVQLTVLTRPACNLGFLSSTCRNSDVKVLTKCESRTSRCPLSASQIAHSRGPDPVPSGASERRRRKCQSFMSSFFLETKSPARTRRKDVRRMFFSSTTSQTLKICLLPALRRCTCRLNSCLTWLSACLTRREPRRY